MVVIIMDFVRVELTMSDWVVVGAENLDNEQHFDALEISYRTSAGYSY